MTFQKVHNGLVELTDQGVWEIEKHTHIYSDETKPIKPKKRNWSALNMINLWVGMLVSIAVYQVASGLIVSGMTWYQALFTIVLGHSLVMIFAIVLGHFGTKYGLNYPMLCRLAFGTRGAIVPALVRGLLGCFWFGVQAWIGGQAVQAIIQVCYPAWINLGFHGQFISFITFWLINVVVAAAGSDGVKKLENLAAPLLIVLSAIVIFWGISAANGSIVTLLSAPILHGNSEVGFWKLFFPALSAMIAFDGGIALSMADFTRHCTDQRSQIAGQLISAPVMTLFISFVGICGTAGAYLAFGEEIWEPAVLVSHFSSPLIVIIFSLFIIMAVLTTNVAANLVPPSNIISTLLKGKISYKWATFTAAILALFAQPWNALSSAYELIFNVCAVLGALLGPISGLYLAVYLVQYKTKVNMVDLYRDDKDSTYYYQGGWNIPILISFFLCTFVIMLGKYYAPLQFVFDNSYVLGAIGAAIIYMVLIKLWPKKRGAEGNV